MNLQQAKTLRSTMTDVEKRLWYRLRAHRFAGFKFKRQVPVGPYIVDFACLNRRLIIEVDGGQHGDVSNDCSRDNWLNQRGFHVLRFWNNEVLRNTESVLETIMDRLNQTSGGSPSPGAARHPLPSGERGPDGNAEN